MNKRIRELAEQAVKAVDNPFPSNPLNDELEKMYIPDCFAEKFAELIVRECAEIAKKKAFIIMQKAEEYAADKEEMINATSAAFQLEILEQEIRKHFGDE